MSDKSLTTREPQEMTVARPQPSVADMLHLVIDKGITAENVAAFKELVQLHREEVKLNAEKEFAAAFVELQRELPVINGYRPIPDKQGRTKFCYANFEDIDAIVRPICLRHGFTYGFHESAIENGRITVTMTLQHSGGHSRQIPYSVRAGGGPPGANESQADVSGHTYAQRGAIESGLALRIIGRPDDPRMEGGPVTTEQAEELERRVQLTNSDRDAFLKFAGAKSYAEIPASAYERCDDMLRRKERR